MLDATVKDEKDHALQFFHRWRHPNSRDHGTPAAGIIAQPMISLYSASKFALEGFSESLSFELAAVGIAVKIIQPSGGITSTKFGDRTAKEATPLAPPPDYDAFVAATRKTFAKLASAAKTDTPEGADNKINRRDRWNCLLRVSSSAWITRR